MSSGPTISLLPSARAWMLACVIALAAFIAVDGQTAQAAMKSEKISKNVCKTTGGGKFVRAKGTGGIKIDKRLVPDIRWMKRKFNLKFGDGYNERPRCERRAPARACSRHLCGQRSQQRLEQGGQACQARGAPPEPAKASMALGRI